jgi:hypothetical protein
MAPPTSDYVADYAPPNVEGKRFDSMAKVDGYDSWGPEDLADYLEREGLGDYREVLSYHKIVSVQYHTKTCIHDS